tara:strand:- start:111 stop:368 length:258 start_codon:yes stop_codon:yes gene_type:complete
MKNDDRIQILTESGGNWTGTWEEIVSASPNWFADLHASYVLDLKQLLDQGNAYNGGGSHRGERFFVFKKGFEVSEVPSIKKYKGE